VGRVPGFHILEVSTLHCNHSKKRKNKAIPWRPIELYDVSVPQFLDIWLKGGGEVVSGNALTMVLVTRKITGIVKLKLLIN
jgi:hypothetical protein